MSDRSNLAYPLGPCNKNKKSPTCNQALHGLQSWTNGGFVILILQNYPTRRYLQISGGPLLSSGAMVKWSNPPNRYPNPCSSEPRCRLTGSSCRGRCRWCCRAGRGTRQRTRTRRRRTTNTRCWPCRRNPRCRTEGRPAGQ